MYRWRKCGGKVLTEQEVFSVDIVERNIGGCYSCEADNGFSITPVSSQLSVIVQCKDALILYITLSYLHII